MATDPDQHGAAGTGGSLARRACPACGASGGGRELPAYRHEGWRIEACAGCGFVYLANPPDYAALVDEFAWEKMAKAEAERRLKSRPISKRLSNATRWRLRLAGNRDVRVAARVGGGNVLDIGCGGGRQAFLEAGTPFGIEISRALHAAADEKMRARGGYAVHAPALDGLKSFPDAMFDGVIMNSYLEHEAQPAAVLAEVQRVLKPGGRVYVRVPNFGGVNRRVTGRNWCGFRYPDHVNYFTVSSLRAMTRNAGFGMRLLNRLSVPFDDNIKALLTKS